MNSLKLIQHINSLSDISDIMNAMKYLSQMESNKLSRFIQHQKRAMQSIRIAADDFLQFHPELQTSPEAKVHVLVVLGSERGFCGNYNDVLQQKADEFLKQTATTHTNTRIIAVGYKLHGKFEAKANHYKSFPGPRLVEEIPDILSQLINEISRLSVEQQAIHLSVLHHSDDQPNPIIAKVLPAFQSIEYTPISYGSAPRTHLPDKTLFAALLDEYLFALLNQIFYTAFMSENQHRIRHMENAVNKLSNKLDELTTKRNEVRQEEITEELEVILLSSSAIETIQE